MNIINNNKLYISGMIASLIMVFFALLYLNEYSLIIAIIGIILGSFSAVAYGLCKPKPKSADNKHFILIDELILWQSIAENGSIPEDKINLAKYIATYKLSESGIKETPDYKKQEKNDLSKYKARFLKYKTIDPGYHHKIYELIKLVSGAKC